VEESAVTIRPDESSTLTTGCTANATAAVAVALGCVVTISLVATPVILKDWLVAVSEPLVAVTLSPVPTMLHLQPEKVATPPTCATAEVHPLRVPVDPVPVVSVTLFVVLTVLPKASSVVTTGWIGKAAVIAVAPLGCVVNPSACAVPGPIVKLPEVPAIEPWVAVNVVLCASYRVTPDAVPKPDVKVTDTG
jgi:hypothetical protein